MFLVLEYGIGYFKGLGLYVIWRRSLELLRSGDIERVGLCRQLSVESIFS